MFSARIYAAHSVFYSYLNMPTSYNSQNMAFCDTANRRLCVVKRFIFTDDPVAI